MDAIFHLSDSENASEEPRSPEPERVISKPEPAERKPEKPKRAAPSPEQPDFQEAIDEIREQMDLKARKFEHELEDLKRQHAEQLSIIKQTNIAKEQSAANAYNLEYRNSIWSVTLKHLGKGVFTDEIAPLLEHNLGEEQFKLEKELLELQQRYDDELAQAKMNPVVRKRRHHKRKSSSTVPISPQQLAQLIVDRIDQPPRKQVEKDPNDVIVDKMIQVVRSESEALIDRQQVINHRRAAVVPHRPISQRKEQPKRTTHRRENPMDQSCIVENIDARKKMKKRLMDTDKFLRDLHKQEWFDDIFPHVE